MNVLIGAVIGLGVVAGIIGLGVGMIFVLDWLESYFGEGITLLFFYLVVGAAIGAGIGALAGLAVALSVVGAAVGEIVS